MSHPWNAAPAELVPLHLMGLTSVAPAFRRVRISPLPSRELQHGKLRYPSLRGTFEVSFMRSKVGITVNATVPGNTEAELCVPAYLLEAGTSQVVNLRLNGVAVTESHRQGGVSCVEVP